MSDEVSPEFKRFLNLLKKKNISRQELHECVSYLADELVSLKIQVDKNVIENLEGHKKLAELIVLASD